MNTPSTHILSYTRGHLWIFVFVDVFAVCTEFTGKIENPDHAMICSAAHTNARIYLQECSLSSFVWFIILLWILKAHQSLQSKQFRGANTTALGCRTLSAKNLLIIELFCGNKDKVSCASLPL